MSNFESDHRFSIGTQVGFIDTGKYGTIISEIARDVWVVEWDDGQLSKASSHQLKLKADLESDFSELQNEFSDKITEAARLLREAADLIRDKNINDFDLSGLGDCGDALRDCEEGGWRSSSYNC